MRALIVGLLLSALALSEQASAGKFDHCDRYVIDNVRFSNRPFGVKRFQAIHNCSVDVAHGLALLFGIGTKGLPSWDPRTRWNNLLDGLAVS